MEGLGESYTAGKGLEEEEAEKFVWRQSALSKEFLEEYECLRRRSALRSWRSASTHPGNAG